MLEVVGEKTLLDWHWYWRPQPDLNRCYRRERAI